MIPPFDERGNLPPGIHKASWSELEAKFGESPWRKALLFGLREALECLHRAGCRTAYLNGSFITANETPRDFDACWNADGVDFDAVEPDLLDFSEGRRAQKMRFGGELFPADMAADPKGTAFLCFFQHDRASGRSKGILEIDLENGL